MTTLALKIDRARYKHLIAPDIKPPLFLAYNADAPVAHHAIHRPGIISRTATALNKSFAFCFVVVALLAFNAIGAAAAWYVDDLDIRTLAAELTADTSLPPPLQQSGTFDREAGRRR